MPKVLISPAPLFGIQAEFLDVLKKAGLEPTYPKKRAQLTEPELLEELQGIHGCIAGSEPYTRKVLAAHPQFKVIARAGVGYDAVDCQAATDHGVAVCIAPGTNQDAVAEHTFAMILALAKNLISQHAGTVAGKWPRNANLPLRGRVLGIAGMGRIGKAVAVRGQAFGMKMLAFEPYPDHDFAKQYGVTFVPWERLLAESDYVSLHMPMTAQAKHAINRKTLAMMKPSAFLVNTARGGLVCEADVVEALKAKKIAGVGLDVFEEEPPRVDQPLFQLDNVVFTPHAAGVDVQSRDDMALSAAHAIVSLMRGEWPAEKVMNPEVKGKFKW